SPERHAEVVAEVRRGVSMVTELPVEPSPLPGWVRIACDGEVMTEWLARAILMENVSARCEGSSLDVPAGPAYRLGKEIKNVVTACAKTGHYWIEHMWLPQQRDIRKLFARMRESAPLVQPGLPGRDYHGDEHKTLRQTIASAIHDATGLSESPHQYATW